MNYLEFIQNNKLPDNVSLKAKELFEGFSDKKTILPKIKSITITGLYPYKSDYDIKINNEKANIIYGGNGAGKTTAINSIEFGLLGSASDFEIKSNFSNRVLNKFIVNSVFEIEDNSYLLQRSLTPNAESHNCIMSRISETDLDVEYEKFEGVREVNALFHSLTGQTVNEFAKIFDFLSLRVPRRHYLASNIFNSPGTLYRQKLFTKLLGHSKIANISEETYKRWNQAKNSISQSKKRLNYLEPLQDMEVNQIDSEVQVNLDNELNLLTSKILELKAQKKLLYSKQNDLQSKEPKFEHQEELIETQFKLQKLEQIEQNEWICSTCESDYSDMAQKRLKHGDCPSCGQSDFVMDQNQQEYNEYRERIHQLSNAQKKYQQKSEKFRLIQGKFRAEFQALDREIDILSEKEKKLIKQNTVISPGRTNDLIFQLENDIKNYQDDEVLFGILYQSTKEFIEQTTKDFIQSLNERFAYYQRELFDISKWALGPNFELIADDGQEFKHLSHGEKNITDIIFRMAIIDSLKEADPELNLFLIIDTPEEGLDDAFHKRFQHVLFEYVKIHKGNLVVLTSCDREFVDSLESEHFRLENLLIKSSNSRPFQVKQLKLIQFLN